LRLGIPARWPGVAARSGQTPGRSAARAIRSQSVLQRGVALGDHLLIRKRQPKHTGEDRSSIPALGWCRMIGGLWVGMILSEHHARAA
jgi:hypothetical protein